MQLLQRLHFLSRAEMLHPVRKTIRQLAQEQGCNDEKINAMVMAINEACMNIIQHAYKNDPNGEIILEFWRKPRSIVIKLLDFSATVDKATIRSRDLDDIRPGGLGVHLIHEVMDKVAYLDNPDEAGNILQMEKFLNVE